MDVTTLSLDLLQLNVDSVQFQGSLAPFSYNDTLLVIDLGGTLTSGTTDSVVVYYNGSPQQDPSGWGGFYFQNPYYYNLGVGFQSDPHNYGRVWHPCFDNFVERATYDYSILTNNNFTAYCNGTRTSVTSVGTDSLLTNWDLATEIPSYIASVAVADYVHVTQNYFSTSQTLNIPMWLVARENDTTNLKNSFVNLGAAMEAYETLYGPYVWERVGFVMVPFSSGAMEHATNIAYPLITANGTIAFQTLMAHELSHHWWGDWVTCETAEEMWINEGMAVYSEHLFLEYVYDYDTYLNEVRSNHYDVLHRAHVDDSGHYALNAVPIKFTYGEHSYRKGACVMHNLRAYMGDTDFFAGLQSIQTNFAGGNINSFQFRDELNTIGGTDVTDFFDDWIFQAGFSQFEVAKMTATQNGGNYDVELVIDQRLKGAANFHNNVPMQVTFRDANWNTHSEMLNLGGDYQVVNLTIPLNPVYVGLNEDHKINQAVTSEERVLTQTGIELMQLANTRLTVSTLTDSAFVRVEHNWVYADQPQGLNNIVASPDRYWTVHGVDLQNVSGKLKFDYNAQNTSAGDLDNGLMVDAGGQAFHEDSLVLLYRPSIQDDWQVHPDYNHNTMGSKFDKLGFMETNTFAAGQYCFGYRVYSVNTPELPDVAAGYKIYPNPADDSVNIDLSGWQTNPYRLEIYGINGMLLTHKAIVGGQVNQLDLSELDAGTYVFIISDSDGLKRGSKRVVMH